MCLQEDMNHVPPRRHESCASKKTCCPDSVVCSQYGTLERVHQLKKLCDGKRQCQVTVARRECDYHSYTDTESVRYFCNNNIQGTLELGIAILKYTIDLIKT